MFAVFDRIRNGMRLCVAVGAMGVLAACDPTLVGTGTGPSPNTASVNASDPVKVAMLVPSGSGVEELDIIARDLERAARLAIADLEGVTVDLTVYSTERLTATAVARAQEAVADGADIILGPLDGEAAAAVGAATAGSGINVLAFSNNTAIAGGNVFLLGQTFEDSARRVSRFARSQGKSSVVVLHARNVAGEAGRAAVQKALAESGLTMAGTAPYEATLPGVTTAVASARTAVRQTGADAIFLTSNTAGALPIFAELLPEAGLGPDRVQYLGLSRWDADPRLHTLTGVQGAWFAMPDPASNTQFRTRFAATYESNPHILASTAYDGIAAIGSLWASGGNAPLSPQSLTQGRGFRGVTGVFRLLPDGTNERGLAIGSIQNNQVVTVAAAPAGFGGFGS